MSAAPDAALTTLIQAAWAAGQTIDVDDIAFGPDHIEPGIHHGYQPYFALFAGLVRVMNAKAILEIGTWHGSATTALARGWPTGETGTLVTLDREQPRLTALTAMPGVHPMTGAPLDPHVMHRIAARFAGARLDLMYLDDPRHLYEAAATCVGAYGLLLNPRLVLVDDIKRSTGMRAFWSDIEDRWPGRTAALNDLLPNMRPEDCDLGVIDLRTLGEAP